MDNDKLTEIILELHAKMGEVERIHDRLDKTDDKLALLSSKIERWESKLGAFIFIGGCVWAFFMAFKEHFLTVFKGV